MRGGKGSVGGRWLGEVMLEICGGGVVDSSRSSVGGVLMMMMMMDISLSLSLSLLHSLSFSHALIRMLTSLVWFFLYSSVFFLEKMSVFKEWKCYIEQRTLMRFRDV